jgi:predicted transcriptional regulator
VKSKLIFVARQEQTSIPDHKAIGKNVRKERERRKISQAKLAKKVDISGAYLSELERGRRNWTEELFNAVKKAMEQMNGE